MKKTMRTFLILLAGIICINTFAPVYAQETANPNAVASEVATEKVPIEVFVSKDCNHCQDEREFLIDLSLKRDDFEVQLYDIGEKEHKQYWLQLAELEGLSKVTPITIIGDRIIQGFDAPQTTGKKIESLIDKFKGKKTYTFKEFVAAGGSSNIEKVINGTCDDETGVCDLDYEPMFFTVPFVGAVDLKQFSLPVLSIILGFIDGFNPCAMWVLITFLIVLSQVGDRKKMWQIAGLFIIAESVMYYLILNVWFTAWDFVGLDNIVTSIVGIVAVSAGVYFLYKWKTFKGTCPVTNPEHKAKTSKRIQAIVEAEMTIFTILGVLGLALSVNIIEFACSIGIPQTFTKILDLNGLGVFESQLYMGLYILFYMIDDFIVFGIALYSFEKIGVTTKYARWSNLFGGILMIILGLILIFNPTMLTF